LIIYKKNFNDFINTFYFIELIMKPSRLTFTLSLLLLFLINQAFAQTRFAVIGDYGEHSSAEQDVANLIKSWNVDFIVTTGDNSYTSNAIDYNIGYYFADFIYPYYGSYGNDTATVNRFWATLGNHDYTDGGGLNAYLNYFTYPNNERYYDIVLDNIHFFMINSVTPEPDGETENSIQGQWMTALMTECLTNHNHWRVAAFHHPAFSSGNHGSTTYMRWNFQNYGIHAVLNGHDHTYERLTKNGVMYFVNGLGGRSIYSFGNPLPETQFRYNGDYGAQLVTVNGNEMKLEFYNRSGELIDSYTITNAGLPLELLSATINSLTEVTLYFSKLLDPQSAQNASNYNINNGINVISAVLNSNNKDVTLITSSHNYNQQYAVTVSNITDTEGHTISSQANSAQYLLEGDTTPPELLSANINSQTELKLFFSEPLEMQSALNPENYSIDNGISVLSAVLNSNNKDVTLTTSAHNYNQQYTVTVSNVTDLFGNTMSSQKNSASYLIDSTGTGELYKQYIVTAHATDWFLDFHPERSIDGIAGTTTDSRWAGAIPMPDTLIFDLGTPVRFSRTRISFYEWDFGRTYEYALKVSNDMVNWQTVIANTFSNTSQWNEDTFNTVEGRYLLLVSLSNNQSVWAGVWEAEIWGPDDQATGVETAVETPTDYRLSQNYPNPFNPVTNIIFSLPEESRVRITIYNLLGEQVAELVNSYFASGTHTVLFDANDFTSGMYFYKMEAGEFIEIKKMTLMK
jgi:hypothetical protein